VRTCKMKKPREMPQEVWEMFLDQREAAKIVGKGWTVSISGGVRVPYSGYALRNGRRITDGTGSPRWTTKADAIKYAVSHAHKHGTLDWNKTVRWLKLMRIEVSISELAMPHVQKHAKGWYMDQPRKGDNGFWQLRSGPSHRKSVYWCLGATPRATFQRAIRMGLKDEPCYDPISSRMWFERRGWVDCVELA